MDVLDAIFAVARRHLSLAYVWLTCLLTATPLLVFIADLVRFSSLGYGVESVPHVALRTPWHTTSLMLRLLLSVGIAIPLVVGILHAYTSKRRLWTRRLLGRTKWTIVAQVTVIVILLALVPIALAMECLSGLSHANDRASQAAFASWYMDVARALGSLWLYAVPVLCAIGFLAFEAMIEHKAAAAPFRRYLERTKLADCPGRYFPRASACVINLNAGALAPEIPLVEQKARAITSRYHTLVAGTTEAQRFLQDTAAKCRRAFCQHFIPSDLHDKYKLLFLSNTSRALEVTLLRRPCDCCILSPFEHPVEYAVARWLRSRSIDAHIMEWSAEIYEKPWAEQLENMIDDMRKLIAGRTSPCLVISAVSALTGQRIPVGEVVDAIEQDTVIKGRIRVIIDAAHAFGNDGEVQYMRCNADIVASGHKWLMSPCPIGVALWKDGGDSENVPYDAWTDELPSTTVTSSTVACLLASLALFDEIDVETMRARSVLVRDGLVEGTRGQLEVVGNNNGLTGTSMCSFRPAAGYRWKVGITELEATLRQRGIAPAVLKVAGEAWVRVTCPYFVDFADVMRASRVLRGIVTEV